MSLQAKACQNRKPKWRQPRKVWKRRDGNKFCIREVLFSIFSYSSMKNPLFGDDLKRIFYLGVKLYETI